MTRPVPLPLVTSPSLLRSSARLRRQRRGSWNATRLCDCAAYKSGGELCEEVRPRHVAALAARGYLQLLEPLLECHEIRLGESS